MRVTNNMINRTSMTNMNSNKVTVDALNTQMTTQKKISRPSEDPVIAIRALRLRSGLSEVNQYYNKNIPDAESWLELTETALTNMKTITTDVYRQCVKGSTDTLTAEDRDAILQSLQALRSQVYKEGNADNAGRTIFTGYKTKSKLTFVEDEVDTRYQITEKLSYKDIEERKYYGNLVELPNTKDEVDPGVPLADMPQEATNMRLRLSYADLKGTKGVDDTWMTDPAFSLKTVDKDGKDVTLKDKGGADIDLNVTTMPLNEWKAGEKAPNDGSGVTTWTREPYAVGDDAILFIPETGEIILGKNVSEQLKGAKADLSVTYNKQGFKDGELRPEHYFDCVNVTGTNKIEYKKEIQEIAYTVAFDQKLVVNTQASDVFNSAIGRDVDELTNAVSAAIEAHEKVNKLKEMKGLEQYSDKESQEKLSQWIEAAEKEASYMDHNMQKLYGEAVGNFQEYLSGILSAQTEVGSKGDQLKMTKNRVENQQYSFEKLKTSNEDRELSDIIIDYTSAYTAYQASLMAASKINQQTLLNYL